MFLNNKAPTFYIEALTVRELTRKPYKDFK